MYIHISLIPCLHYPYTIACTTFQIMKTAVQKKEEKSTHRIPCAVSMVVTLGKLAKEPDTENNVAGSNPYRAIEP